MPWTETTDAPGDIREWERADGTATIRLRTRPDGTWVVRLDVLHQAPDESRYRRRDAETESAALALVERWQTAYDVDAEE